MRLTLLYTGLFVACGALVIAITYGLVASLPAEEYGPVCPPRDRDTEPGGVPIRR